MRTIWVALIIYVSLAALAILWVYAATSPEPEEDDDE